MSGPVEVRSYRLCFELERRIHRIDRWRIPVPWGLPLRGAVYALLALAVMLLASATPGVGAVVGALPAPLRLAVIPVGVAVGLVRWRLDGRPAHHALMAVLKQAVGPSTLRSYRRTRRPRNEERYAAVALARDAAAGGLRRGRVVGPARLAVVGCGDVRRRRRRLVVRGGTRVDRRVEVDLAASEVLEVRP